MLVRTWYERHLLEMLLLSWYSRCLKSFSHLLIRHLVDFATGIALSEYLQCRGLVRRGSRLIADERSVPARCEPAQKCPDKHGEQCYPENCPKQGEQPPKKVRTMEKSKHQRLSFLVFGIICTGNINLLKRYTFFFKTHTLYRTMIRRNIVSSGSCHHSATSRSLLYGLYPPFTKEST